MKNKAWYFIWIICLEIINKKSLEWGVGCRIQDFLSGYETEDPRDSLIVDKGSVNDKISAFVVLKKLTVAQIFIIIIL